MCGILCCICDGEQPVPDLSTIPESIRRRGPDYQSELEVTIGASRRLRFISSVLWLQGSTIMTQPYETDTGILMFNGDIYYESNAESDVKYLGDQLAAIEYHDLARFIYSLNGPFAFVYFDKRSNRVLFARDKFGRKSLLFASDTRSILIASCARKLTAFDFHEVPAIGLFTIEFGDQDCRPIVSVQIWHSDLDFASRKLHDFEVLSGRNVIVSGRMVHEKLQIDCQIDYELLDANCFEKLLVTGSAWFENTVCLVRLLRDAVRTRANYQPDRCRHCTRIENESEKCLHCPIGVLFSGGLDCTLLALLLDEFVERNKPIDLLNVAFEKQPNDSFATPDRLTARQSLIELQRLRPDREWCLFEINVSKRDLSNWLDTRIRHLIYPRNSILDESLGCALWFAANWPANETQQTSSCRILISGVGADELFGGYSRHRRAFASGTGCNWSKLDEELHETWIQIAERNLARDDRVISDSGRQLRMPYLDEHVVRFAHSLRPWQKCYPKPKNIGFGDKLLLRAAAHYLQLTATARLAKRALQFGSRIANKHENGNEISPRLTFDI